MGISIGIQRHTNIHAHKLVRLCLYLGLLRLRHRCLVECPLQFGLLQALVMELLLLHILLVHRHTLELTTPMHTYTDTDTHTEIHTDTDTTDTYTYKDTETRET